MPQLTLIGDSIRMGYQPVVADRLEGKIDVWGPEANGGNTANLLQCLHAWAIARKPAADTVHINAGLHDLKTVMPDLRDQVIPPDHYRRNVRLLLQLLRDHTDAKLIWATTTPVIDERFRTRWNEGLDVGFLRYNEDVIAYNAVATEICGELNVAVHDLYTVVEQAGPHELMTEDGVHFTEAGYAVLAAAVANAVAG